MSISNGGRAVMMIVATVLILGFVGWGVNSLVHQVEDQLPRAGGPPALNPDTTTAPPAAAPTTPPSPSLASPAPEAAPAAQTEVERIRAAIAEARAKALADMIEVDAVRPGGDVKAPKAIDAPAPRYPEAARRARIQGVVVLETLIDRDGSVVRTRVLKGLPMGLDKAAQDAVGEWKFAPATRHGEPVPCLITLTVNFQLR